MKKGFLICTLLIGALLFCGTDQTRGSTALEKNKTGIVYSKYMAVNVADQLITTFEIAAVVTLPDISTSLSVATSKVLAYGSIQALEQEVEIVRLFSISKLPTVNYAQLYRATGHERLCGSDQNNVATLTKDIFVPKLGSYYIPICIGTPTGQVHESELCRILNFNMLC